MKLLRRYATNLALSLSLITSSLYSAAQPSIFREYDIRGIVDEEFSPQDAGDIAVCIATYLREINPNLKTFAVGADGRVHSPAIKTAVTAALLACGFDIVDIGTCTTPVMYFGCHTLPVEASLMITASHNPGRYNGIKICSGKELIAGDQIRKIRDLYYSGATLPTAAASGNVSTYDLIDDYVAMLQEKFPHLAGAGIRAILDCGNGAAGTVLPKLIDAMGWNNVVLLFGEVDGTYPNHEADPTVEKNMAALKAALNDSTADFGVGFDGDCDRMAPMTKAGRLIKGDELVAILSKPIVQQRPGSPIVFDISSSSFVHEAVKSWGGRPCIARTGVAAVKKVMQDEGAVLGGEISCHTIFKDRYFGFDDGIYSMMRVFELLQNSGHTLEDMLQELPSAVSSPTYRLPCQRSVCLEIIDQLKTQFEGQPDIEVVTIDGLRVHFPNGWAIVRPSNTEPLISMRFEGRTNEDLNSLLHLFCTVIGRYIDCSAMQPR